MRELSIENILLLFRPEPDNPVSKIFCFYTVLARPDVSTQLIQKPAMGHPFSSTSDPHNLSPNIIHLFPFQSSKQTFSKRPPHQNSVWILRLPIFVTFLAQCSLYDFTTLTIKRTCINHESVQLKHSYLLKRGPAPWCWLFYSLKHSGNYMYHLL
jgi:hypothetical protein